MVTINLRDIFPEEKLDCLIEVPDGDEEAFRMGLTKEIADVYFTDQRKENAYQRRMYWNNSHYSIEQNDGIENDAISETADPVFKEFVDKLARQQILDAIGTLPEIQSRRIYAFYYLGMNMSEIAKKEGVNKSQVTRSIKKALENLKNILKKLI